MCRCRAVASGVVGGGGRGGWDRSSLWMDLFSLDSSLVIVTCNCLPFSYLRWFFSETYLVTSAENNVLDPPNLNFFFFGGGGGPPDALTRLVLSALVIMPLRPITKDLLMALK